MANRWIIPFRALAERRASLSSVPLPSSWSSLLLSSPATPELCGRGDRKTKKGKRFRGTYGKSRPKKDKRIARFKEKIEVPSSTPWPLPFKVI